MSKRIIILVATISFVVAHCWALPVTVLKAEDRTILGLPAIPNLGALISRTIPGLPSLESLASSSGLASLINPSISIPGFSTFRSMMTGLLGLFPNFLSF